ncbi:hypothetical protein HYQ46_007078 [Verticillium longisporum]|nr:hypothetical protein HYQ46_007078 [Verticillium longisporum]
MTWTKKSSESHLVINKKMRQNSTKPVTLRNLSILVHRIEAVVQVAGLEVVCDMPSTADHAGSRGCTQHGPCRPRDHPPRRSR